MEDVVRPVAVVNVPVEDQDAPGVVPLQRVPCADRDAVEKAEAHRPRVLGVMPRRAVQRGAERRGAAEQRVDERDGAARGVPCGLVGARGDEGVGVERPAPEAQIASSAAL